MGSNVTREGRGTRRSGGKADTSASTLLGNEAKQGRSAKDSVIYFAVTLVKLGTLGYFRRAIQGHDGHIMTEGGSTKLAEERADQHSHDGRTCSSEARDTFARQ